MWRYFLIVCYFLAPFGGLRLWDLGYELLALLFVISANIGVPIWIVNAQRGGIEVVNEKDEKVKWND